MDRSRIECQRRPARRPPLRAREYKRARYCLRRREDRAVAERRVVKRASLESPTPRPPHPHSRAFDRARSRRRHVVPLDSRTARRTNRRPPDSSRRTERTCRRQPARCGSRNNRRTEVRCRRSWCSADSARGYLRPGPATRPFRASAAPAAPRFVRPLPRKWCSPWGPELAYRRQLLRYSRPPRRSFWYRSGLPRPSSASRSRCRIARSRHFLARRTSKRSTVSLRRGKSSWRANIEVPTGRVNERAASYKSEPRKADLGRADLEGLV